METLFALVEDTTTIRCPVTFENWAECSLEAGHEGVHRGHVSHDLTRAFVILGEYTLRAPEDAHAIHTNGSMTP